MTLLNNNNSSSTTANNNNNSSSSSKSAEDIENDIKVLEQSIDEKGNQLNQLLLLIKDERQKGNNYSNELLVNNNNNNEKENLKSLSEKMEQTKLSSIEKNEKAKQEIMDLQKQLLELQKKSSNSEIQLQRILSSSNPSISQNELIALKDEYTKSLLFIQQKYQQLQTESKAREEDNSNKI
ncbi:hypothetical protein PPL_06079 [Heterostelium album PN500]|uniref:Uncharacterized protein n=1 Tax=Heterostelium pallidum (strain ATCC 26659 / Pp 5 / PN500) TaxID=670386 RepID=D3BC57_HETP5|nr:hypothetical protein PPL_06079 [Heterostelium album PN500]EFA81240.1 hypothetical protein PPL_06079 [Heterostelium album PN500]|eukprot:XP_020433358.1 hypothetical protein PPL_06079 [Heterostelium album PN500]